MHQIKYEIPEIYLFVLYLYYIEHQILEVLTKL